MLPLLICTVDKITTHFQSYWQFLRWCKWITWQWDNWLHVWIIDRNCFPSETWHLCLFQYWFVSLNHGCHQGSVFQWLFKILFQACFLGTCWLILVFWHIFPPTPATVSQNIERGFSVSSEVRDHTDIHWHWHLYLHTSCWMSISFLIFLPCGESVSFRSFQRVKLIYMFHSTVLLVCKDDEIV